jgi:hypothetical protein
MLPCVPGCISQTSLQPAHLIARKRTHDISAASYHGATNWDSVMRLDEQCAPGWLPRAHHAPISLLWAIVAMSTTCVNE